MAAASRFGGETAPAACAVQVCALEPPTPELPLDPARLGEAVLRRMVLADSRGGVPARRDVLQSVNSGLTCMFVRMLSPAIYGSVWDALEIQLGDGGQFTVLRDEQGLEKRLAIKRMPWDRIIKLRGEVQEDPLHEIAALTVVQHPGHPHVLKMVEALDDGDTVYLVTPFVDGGELFDWVKDNGASTEDVVKPLFRQLVDGLQYIHSKGLCHADMSLENALVDVRRENAYIIDFGMSVAMPSDSHGRRLMLVPDARASKKTYCAPEFFKGKAYDAVKIDVFSCGCMLFMMLAGFPAFNAPSRTDSGFKQAVCKSDVQGLLQKFGLPPLPDEAAHLLKAMMAYKAADRPMPEEVLKHPWLAPPAHAFAVPLDDARTSVQHQHPPPPQQQAPPAPDGDRRSILPQAAAQQDGFPAASTEGGGVHAGAHGGRVAGSDERGGATAPGRARTVPAGKQPPEGQQQPRASSH